jgi:hypothetical protein
VLERGLGRDEYAADINVDHAVHLLQRSLLERLRNGCTGIVHKDVKPAEGRDGLFDGGIDGAGIGGVRLNRDRLSAGALDRFDDRRGSRGIGAAIAKRLVADVSWVDWHRGGGHPPTPATPPCQRTFDIADSQNHVVEHCSLLQITGASTAFSPLDTAWIASGGMFKVFCPRNPRSSRS